MGSYRKNACILSQMYALFENIEPYASGYLEAGQHKIYYEECGNPDGKPAVFLHGGPGGGGSSKVRGFFNPELFRIVIFDQRGCGRSKPHACLEQNTTWDLVEDSERLMDRLGIKTWLVFGGAWGVHVWLWGVIGLPMVGPRVPKVGPRVPHGSPR